MCMYALGPEGGVVWALNRFSTEPPSYSYSNAPPLVFLVSLRKMREEQACSFFSLLRSSEKVGISHLL